MSANRFTVPDAVDTETVQSVGKIVLATVALVWLLWLVSMLPGVGRFIPGTPVTFAALVGAIATVLVVGLLLYLAPALAGLVRSTVDGPENVVDDVASITHLFIVLVAVLVAHRGLAQLLVPLLENPLGLGNAGWTYDIVFLALALPPLAILAARVYVSLDPMSELLAKKVTKTDDTVTASSPQTSLDETTTDNGETTLEDGKTTTDDSETTAAEADDVSGDTSDDTHARDAHED